MEDAAERWSSIRRQTPAHVSILIVSKFQGLPAIVDLARRLPEEGRLFGENYQSEVIDKLRELAKIGRIPGFEFHMIGHLQSNKVRKLFVHDTPHNYISCIETISSIREADMIDKVLSDLNRRVNVFIQINLHGFEQQSGCSAGDLNDLMFHLIERKTMLTFKGLMCIADRADPAASYAKMTALRLEAKNALKDKYKREFDLILSMGMSEDYGVALAHGSDEIRIGTAIMGSRIKSPTNQINDNSTALASTA